MTRRSLSALALATALLSGCGHAPLSLAQAGLAARTAAMSATKAHHLGARMDGVAMMKDDESGGTTEDVDSMEKASLPASADLRAGCYPTIRNQGYTEGCVGFATAALGEYLLKTRQHKSVQLSPLYIWSLARKQEGSAGQNVGTWPADAMKFAHELGYLPESSQPFMEGADDKAPHFADMIAWKPTSADEKEAKALRPVTGVKTVGSIHQLKKQLAGGLPVVIAVTILESFDATGKDGMVPLPKKGESSRGGHAMLCVGYDNNSRRLTLRNSWGDGWGDHGYCYIPYDYVRNQLCCEGLTTTDN